MILEKPIEQWLHKQMGIKPVVNKLSGDASNRHYYRCNNNILSYESQTPNQVQSTINAFNLLKQNAIAIPKVYASCTKLGVILQEDLGDLTLWHYRNQDLFFAYAIESIDSIHKLLKSNIGNLSVFDKRYMLQECDLIINWCQTNWDSDAVETYKAICENLCQYIDKLPKFPMHRDYHSRNLMVKNQQVFVIDAQDMMLGPIFYDLASLLKDCYIDWPDNIVDAELIKFINKYKHLNLNKKDFDFVSIQRHLKAIGIFARLNCRDNKPQFLQYIKPTMTKMLSVTGLYKETAKLNDLFSRMQ